MRPRTKVPSTVSRSMAGFSAPLLTNCSITDDLYATSSPLRQIVPRPVLKSTIHGVNGNSTPGEVFRKKCSLANIFRDDHPIHRRELYEKMWRTSTAQFANEFGISDAALEKACQKHDIPKPPLPHPGLQELQKAPPLRDLFPKTSVVLRFSVDTTTSRRKAFASSRLGGKSQIPKAMATIVANVDLSPKARELQLAIEGGRSVWHSQIEINHPEFPHIIASKVQAARIPAVLDSIIHGAKAAGITVLPGDAGKNETLKFAQGNVGLELEFEEPFVGGRSARWEQDAKLEGFLICYIVSGWAPGGTRCKWTETPSKPLEVHVESIVKGMLLKLEALRIQQAKWDERAREIPADQHRKEHSANLNKAKEIRENNFLRAAANWSLHITQIAYINACEAQWNTEGKGVISPEQQNWLNWARRIAEKSSPFAFGYPHPVDHGPFDPDAIAEGGPYPLAEVIFPTP